MDNKKYLKLNFKDKKRISNYLNLINKNPKDWCSLFEYVRNSKLSDNEIRNFLTSNLNKAHSSFFDKRENLLLADFIVTVSRNQKTYEEVKQNIAL